MVRKPQHRADDWKDEHRESLIMLGNAVIKRTPEATLFQRTFVVMLGS